MFFKKKPFKIFGVGCNKTGTSSLAYALKTKGIEVAPQRPAERLIHEWARRDFKALIAFCKKYRAFQDIPFSFPYTFQAMDSAFPGSKFILTIRDSPEQWYESFMRFHRKRLGIEGLKSFEPLKNDPYVWKGWACEALKLHYNVEDSDPFNAEILKQSYRFHNQCVQEYFRHRPSDLLVLNVAAPDAFEKLCGFLGLPFNGEPFPWENKS